VDFEPIDEGQAKWSEIGFGGGYGRYFEKIQIVLPDAANPHAANTIVSSTPAHYEVPPATGKCA
jgi:hypothetical protein